MLTINSIKQRKLGVIKLITSGLLVLLSTGCFHTFSSRVTFHENPSRDPDYSETLENNTQDQSVAHFTETSYQMQVTKINTTMKNAMLNRASKVGFDSIAKPLGENDGFLVMIHSSDDSASDLSNKGYWQISLMNDQNSTKPAFIKQIRQKEYSKQFISGTTRWSKEFLIKFDTPVDGSRIRFSNGKSDLIFNW